MDDGSAPRLGRIAVGVDLGEPSQAAAAWVARQLEPDAELLLVHALDTEAEGALGERRRERSEEELASAMELAQERLQYMAEELPCRSVSIRIGNDRPSWVIGREAEAWGAELIVVGPHGGQAEAWARLGSTAERLVRVSPIPVLRVAIPPSAPPRRLLAAVDRVTLTVAVLEWARLLAQRYEAELTLLHVVESDGEEHRAEAEAWLAELRRELPDSTAAETVLVAGQPGAAVLSEARRTGADLVIMGRRGQGRAMPAVLGSTVSEVLHQADCPVLVVVDPSDTILDRWDTDEF